MKNEIVVGMNRTDLHMLVELADFTAALENERQHLELVRGWLRAAVLKEAT